MALWGWKADKTSFGETDPLAARPRSTKAKAAKDKRRLKVKKDWRTLLSDRAHK